MPPALAACLLLLACAASCKQSSPPITTTERGDADKQSAVEAPSSALGPGRNDDTGAAPASAFGDDPPEARELRARLVRQIETFDTPWGSKQWDQRVLDAMRRVPRHLFMPGASIVMAYQDTPHPIGHEQTISQPTVVALMTNALELTGAEKVLEIGTGSGYQAAVLGELARQVYSIEIVKPLGEDAAERLRELGYRNVVVRIGDGYQGWPEHAPFGRILLTAAPPEMPQALVEQLEEGGMIVAPVGGEHEIQELVRWVKRGRSLTKENLGAVRFVPMVPGSTKGQDATTR